MPQLLSSNNLDWSETLNELLTELADQQAPEKATSLAEYLLNGYPLEKAAKETGISMQVANSWLDRYPKLAALASQGESLLQSWRTAKIQQQFLKALNVSEKIMELNFDGTDRYGNKVDPKVLTVIAAQARYTIGLIAGQQKSVSVTHELGDTVMKARNDALNYLADRLKEQDERASEEPIEVAYVVTNTRMDTNIPLLEADGDPHFGKLGELDINESGILCHICGQRAKRLGSHIRQRHAIHQAEYETLYMLPEGSIKSASVDMEDDDE